MTDTPPNRPLPLVLIGSIAVNFLLIGLLIGSQLGGPSPPDRRGPVNPERAISRTVLEAASPEERAVIRRQLGETWQRTGPLRREVNKSRRALKEAISAETYDPARVEAAFSDWREAEADLRGMVQSRLAQQLENVPQAERERLAEALVRPRRRGGGRIRRGENR